MIISEFSLENITSYKEKKTFRFSDGLNILIGPNGGGKSTALYALKLFFEIHLLQRYNIRDSGDHYQFYPDIDFRQNIRNNFSKYYGKHDVNLPSFIELTLQPTKQDVENINLVKRFGEELLLEFGPIIEIQKIREFPASLLQKLQITQIIYKTRDETTEYIEADSIEDYFLKYLKSINLLSLSQNPEIKKNFTLPFYLQGISREEGISYGVNYIDITEQTSSVIKGAIQNPGSQGLSLMSSRIAIIKQESDYIASNNHTAIQTWSDVFYKNEEIVTYKEFLRKLGYEWELKVIRSPKCAPVYTKDNHPTDVSKLSSGEGAIFSMIHLILGSGINNGTFVIDEPEIHLHPRWQKLLLHIFLEISKKRNIQFIFSTHSSIFVTPETICNVTRVYKKGLASELLSLKNIDSTQKSKLLHLVESYNNERIFFADYVVLVEGIKDRLFFDPLIQKLIRTKNKIVTVETIEVDGKNNFQRYETFLKAMDMPYSIIADRDYVLDVGTEEIKNIFIEDNKRIEKKLRDKKSADALSLLNAVIDGEMEDAKEIANYIKSRYINLRQDLTDIEQASFIKFVSDMYDKNIFILKNGEIEDYLPKGKKKNMDNLIDWVKEEDYLFALDEAARAEIEMIAGKITDNILLHF